MTASAKGDDSDITAIKAFHDHHDPARSPESHVEDLTYLDPEERRRAIDKGTLDFVGGLCLFLFCFMILVAYMSALGK